MAIQPQTGKVADFRRWTENLYSVKIDAAFDPFESGQFARIGLPINGENVMRPYSFVNSPADALHEFYYAVVPDGPLSCRLPQLRAGDEVLYVPKPNGYMVLSEIPDARALWMLSTGTAVGPFLSILKNDAVWERFDRLLLAHAVRHAEELSYSEEIANLVQKSAGAALFCAVCQSRRFARCNPRAHSRRTGIGCVAGTGGICNIARRYAVYDLRQSANGKRYFRRFVGARF